MKITERILVILFLISILFYNVLGYENTPQTVALAGSFLAIFYLIGTYWLHKPTKITGRSITFLILYGVVLFSLISALMFTSLNLMGTIQMLMISILLSMINMGMDKLTARNERMVLRNTLRIKIFLLTLLAFIFFFERYYSLFLRERKLFNQTLLLNWLTGEWITMK